MKPVEYLAMRLTIPADDFCFMRNDATFVLGDGRVEVEPVNPGIALDDKMLSAAVIKVVPEELAESMTLQLIRSRNSLVCRRGDADIGLVPIDRGVGQMLDFLAVQNVDNLINRKKHCLLVAANVIIVAALKPAELETDGVSGTGNGAEIEQVSFGDAAFRIITELVLQGLLTEIEVLGATVLLVVGLKRDEGVAIG